MQDQANISDGRWAEKRARGEAFTNARQTSLIRSERLTEREALRLIGGAR